MLYFQATACHYFHSKKARLFSGFDLIFQFFQFQIYKNIINKTDILTTLSTDHSPILFSLSENIGILKDKGLQKFNNSLCHKPDFITELKSHLKVICNKMLEEQITDEQLCWEYMKFEIRKFSIRFLNEKAKKILCRNCYMRK